MRVRFSTIPALMLCSFWLVACTSGLPRESNLEKPRVLGIRLAQPMLLPGQGTTAQALVYDPAWRTAEMHWVVSLNPVATEAIRVDFGDPSTLTTDMGYAYLGTGPTAFIPPLPFPAGLTEALVQNYVEVLTLPLILLVDIPAESRVYAFKNIRIQILEGSIAYLEAEGLLDGLDETERAALIADRQQRVWNTNPLPEGLEVGALDRALSTEERTDLALRKKLPIVPDTLAAEPGQIVRISYPLRDLDNTTVSGAQLAVGDVGYNRLASRFYLETAFRIPLDTVSVDFSLDIFEQDSAFDALEFRPMSRGLYLGAVVGYDRRGGIVWEQFSVDVGSEPIGLPEADSYWLLRQNWLQFWQPLTAAASQFMQQATGPVFVQGTLQLASGLESVLPLDEDEALRSTAGVPMYLEDVSFAGSAPLAATGAITGATSRIESLDDVLSSPTALRSSLGRRIALELHPVRQFSP